MSGSADADVYYSTPYVFFPKDSAGLKDKVVIKQLTGESKEDAGFAFDEKLEVTTYKWFPGEKFIKEQ